MEQCDKYITIIQKYLNDKSIVATSFLKDDIQEKNHKSLIYVAYTIENFSSNSKLEEKIRLLASERGNINNRNDIKRNYRNQLVEFHALYVLTKLMGFNFVDFDMISNKQYAQPNKNCDLCVEKNNRVYFADAKDLSGEIMSTGEGEDDNGNRYEHYTPAIPEVLKGWLKGYITEADKKGADFLMAHIPTWNLFDTKILNLHKFHQKISKDIILNKDKFLWNIPGARLERLIFIKAYGFWEIEVVH
jgi:hypothetical protein